MCEWRNPLATPIILWSLRNSRLLPALRILVVCAAGRAPKPRPKRATYPADARVELIFNISPVKTCGSLCTRHCEGGQLFNPQRFNPESRPCAGAGHPLCCGCRARRLGAPAPSACRTRTPQARPRQNDAVNLRPQRRQQGHHLLHLDVFRDRELSVSGFFTPSTSAFLVSIRLFSSTLRTPTRITVTECSFTLCTPTLLITSPGTWLRGGGPVTVT